MLDTMYIVLKIEFWC